MTQWSTTTKHEPSSINGGRRYELRDRVSIEQLNNMTENGFYAMAAASEAKEKAEEALSFAQGTGTTVYENGKPVAEFNADKKANVDDIPTEYIKDANVENDILTIQKANGLIISFQGGGGGSSYDDTEIKQSIQDLQTNKADKTELKDYVTNTALENKGYLNEIPSEYITETELEAKKYATISAVNTALANKASQSSMEKAQLDIQNLNSNKADKSEIPTTANQVNALPDTTKYGASIDLSMDSTTYVVTAQLKDQDGNNIGSAKTIDLPLESVVVSGSYDATNKKVILTLKDGSKVDFSVADLVSGLQTEITSSNKLSVNLIDGISTVAKTGSYNDLSDKPTIPTDNNQLTNGAGYITPSGLNGYVKVADIQNSLSSTDTDKPLSAYQGNLLYGQIVSIGSNLNKRSFTVIDTQYIRITDLDSGIYKLTYNGHKFLYYYGRTSNISQELYSNGTLILFVTKNVKEGVDAFYWTWEVFAPVADNRYPAIHFGLTEIDSGINRSARLDALTYATSSKAGIVVPDGKTITVNSWGMISAQAGSKVIVEVWK